MNKITLIFALLLCGLSWATAQIEVTVTGQVLDVQSNPIADHLVQLNYQCDNTNAPVLDSVFTDENGTYESKVAFCLAGSISASTICGGVAVAKMALWAQDSSDVVINFHCDEPSSSPDTACQLEIAVLESYPLQLQANALGLEPFTYLWNTGETTRRITADAGIEQYCVTVTTADDCVISQCVDVENGNSNNNCVDPSLIDPDAVCLAIYDPVCGCDGITYSNDCEAVNRGGVTSFTPGPCGSCNIFQQDWIDAILKNPGLCENCIGQIAVYSLDSINYLVVEADNINCADAQSFIYSCEGNVLCVDGGIIGSTECNVFFSNPEFKPVQVLWEKKSPCQPYVPPCTVILREVVADKLYIKATATGVSPFTYQWNTGETTEQIAFVDPGEYCVTVTDAEGCITTACKVVGHDQAPCSIYGKIVDFNDGQGCELLIETLDGEILVPLNLPTIATAGQHIFFSYTSDGGSSTCLAGPAISLGCFEITESDCIDPSLIEGLVTCTAEYDPVCGCDGKTYSNDCVAYHLNGVTSWTDGPCPDDNAEGCDLIINSLPDSSNLSVQLSLSTSLEAVSYHWSFGDGHSSTEADPHHQYEAPGLYFVCATVTDANGEHCKECKLVKMTTIYDPACHDPSMIEGTVLCTADYTPVCGCDGVTYSNDCVAQYFYGVREWTDGPCEQSLPGNVEAFCEVDFSYNIALKDNKQYLVEFSSQYGSNSAVLWSFGDGSFAESPNAIHIYEAEQDHEILAFTVCLNVFDGLQIASPLYDAACFGIHCQTIVIDPNAPGFISGAVFEQKDGLLPGAVITRSSGNPGDPIPDVPVKLLNAKGRVIAQTRTDEQGIYDFENLWDGNYFVQVAIEGIEHEPFPIQLSPQNRSKSNLDFEVSDEAVTTGIRDLNFAENIKLYPNPASHELYIEMDLVKSGEIHFNILNLLGQTVIRREEEMIAGRQKIRLDLTDLIPGLYLISIQTRQEIYSQKIVLKEE